LNEIKDIERKWVVDLEQNQVVSESYLVWRKNLLMARNGKPYLNLIVGDRTGKVEGRVWNNAAELDKRFSAHDIVTIKAKTTRYQDRIQLNIGDIAKMEGEEADLALYIPATTRSVEKMWTRLLDHVDSMSNPHLRKLLGEMLAEPAICKGFKRSPAAKSIHHARAGGLLEHVLSVCGLLESICSHYERIYPGFMDRDLVLAGGILHDLGKIWELGGPTFEYSDSGRLLGHIIMVYEEVSDRIKAQPGFPPDLANHLKHILLSHHGELEYGSPKRPKTAEAWAVHYADILDGRMEWLHDQICNLEPGEWTPFQRLHDRYFWSPVRDFSDYEVGCEEESANDERDERSVEKRSEAEEGDGEQRVGGVTSGEADEQTGKPQSEDDGQRSLFGLDTE
jgi:3'-5' exoribonuclease